MGTLFYNIGTLVGVHAGLHPLRGEALQELPCIEHAYLLTEGDSIHSYGSMSTINWQTHPASHKVDVRNGFLFPSWCDSHTHLVFAGSREDEFVHKIKGATYATIAASGGGILNSAKRLQETDEEELYQVALARLHEVAQLGTGAIEIKSGYGLSTDAELKMLRVIRRLQKTTPLTIRATFLGAHAFPSSFSTDHNGYIRLIIEEMLPAVAALKLADFIDVFCEEGFFSLKETAAICEAGKKIGLGVKLHANQLGLSGGVQLGVSLGAISVDHLEAMDDSSIAALSQAKTIATLLPNASFFLRMQDAPARSLIQAGAAVALASDYNPGSAPSGNMNLVVAQACIRMRMLPAEAINAATINGAHAMGVADICGSIAPGKLANFFITAAIPSINYLPYAFGSSLIQQVVLKGQVLSNQSF
jgi:imidazolonepropionase